MTPTVQQAGPLLDFIVQTEARGSYDAIWGGISRRHYPPLPITKMTIGQVLDWQDSIDHLYGSEASGGPQFLEDTLRDIYAPAGLTRNSRFNRANQRILATHLLKQAGLIKYLRGEMGEEVFANKVAHIWASFPWVSGPKRGQSVYGGDSVGNKALVSVEAFLSAVRSVRTQTVTPPPTGLWARLMAWLRSVTSMIHNT